MRNHRLRLYAVHALRCGLIVALLALLPSPHRGPVSTINEGGRVAVPPLVEIQRHFPTATTIGDSPDSRGCWSVLDPDGQSLGCVIRTLPAAKDQHGYRGPTEALLAMTTAHGVTGVSVLQSHDTRDHVAAVEKDDAFLKQFVGWRFDETHSPNRGIDGVSGATLTSLAMAGGIVQRLSPDQTSTPASLVFSSPLTLTQCQEVLPDAVAIEGDFEASVLDSEGTVIGSCIRTGVFSDDVIGYQGPTELLIAIGTDDRVLDVRITESFDNEPYVGYVRDEAYFWKRYRGEPVGSLATMPDDVEGVSGATMTSVTVAETLAEFGKELLAYRDRQRDPPSVFASIRWSSVEIGSLVMLLALMLFSQAGWMKRKGLRRLWLVAVIAVVGIWSGNLVSLALVAGWSTSGIGWQLAIGLFAIALVAFGAPAVSKSNPYCNHLCPHGAIQQLVRPSANSKRRFRLPRHWVSRMQVIPAITLAIVYLVLLVAPRFDVSVLEPFDAFAWRVAGLGSIVFLVATIAFSLFVPMGYCRLGCPTGRLIDHVRFSASAGKFTTFDWSVVAMLVVAVGRWWWVSA